MTDQRMIEDTQRLYAICAGGDWEAVREMLAEDFVVTEAPDLPFGGVYRGTDGLRDLYARVMGLMTVEGMDLKTMTVGGDWVIVLVTMHTRDEDGPFEIELAEATRFRDGKVAEIKPYYFDPSLVHRAVAAKQAAG